MVFWGGSPGSGDSSRRSNTEGPRPDPALLPLWKPRAAVGAQTAARYLGYLKCLAPRGTWRFCCFRRGLNWGCLLSNRPA